MSTILNSPFNPTILSPGFLNPACNAVADGDLEYVLSQLTKHHFVTYDLPGAEMHDDHGFRLHLGRSLDAPAKRRDAASRLVPDLFELLNARAARRVAILVRNADHLITADAQRMLTLITAVERAAARLADASPATQLLMFFAGPAPAFRPVEPSAKRRAEAQRGPKAMRTDFDAKAWNTVQEFDLRPHHTLTISYAAWYYASLGRRAESPDDRWHCVEADETMTFHRAEDGVPCIAGTFARMQGGMQLVGIQFESDAETFRFPWDGEDPFTLFRRLCEQLNLL